MNGKTVFEHGGNLYAAIRQKGSSMAELLDFSANINPLGIAESVRQAIGQSLEDIVHYPDVDAQELKQAISECYHVDQEWITVGNGAVETMYILCHMLKPRRVLVTAPTFSEYERAARACGAVIDYFDLQPDNGFKIDIPALISQLAGTDIVFIGNPNNPTGTLLIRRELEPLLAAAKKQGTIIVMDESFLDFLTDDSQHTCRHLVSSYDNLVVVHSLTKFYAIPGLRLGFALTNPELTHILHNGKDPWNVNSLAQSAGIAALNDQKYRQVSKAFIHKTKEELYTGLLSLPGVTPFWPSVNFILINIRGTGMTGEQMRRIMLAHNVLIRDCSNYRGLSPDYIRLAVKRPEQNQLLIKILRQVIGDV
jgi:threonine-phosphate decarboxylase